MPTYCRLCGVALEMGTFWMFISSGVNVSAAIEKSSFHKNQQVPKQGPKIVSDSRRFFPWQGAVSARHTQGSDYPLPRYRTFSAQSGKVGPRAFAEQSAKVLPGWCTFAEQSEEVCPATHFPRAKWRSVPPADFRRAKRRSVPGGGSGRRKKVSGGRFGRRFLPYARI